MSPIAGNRVQTLIVGKKPESWNVLVRKHFRVVTKFKKEWEEAVMSAVWRQRLRPVLRYPVLIIIEAKWRYKLRHDIDALATKAAVDALVSAGIMKDDSLAYLRWFLTTGEIGAEKDELLITICEPDAEGAILIPMPYRAPIKMGGHWVLPKVGGGVHSTPSGKPVHFKSAAAAAAAGRIIMAKEGGGKR